MGKRIVTLTTDFGLKDPYQGAMKGVISSISPDVSIIDITHLVSPGDILEGAFILLGAYGFFPEGTVHVGVVDPGVGGERRPILIETRRYTFIGPDNGLLSLAAGREGVVRAIHLTDRRYFLKDVSNTFHGRDIFSPVAAHLLNGADPSEMGEAVKETASLGLPAPVKGDGSVEGVVVYVDSFGNLITNIGEKEIPKGVVEVRIKGASIGGVKRTYADAGKGELVAVIGSTGLLEVAVNSGSASKALRAGVGERIRLEVLR